MTEPEPRSRTARALLIGIASTTYDAALPELPGAADDVQAMHDLLITRQIAVLPAPEDATANTVKSQLISLAQQTRAGELGVFYFSGHGYRVPDGSRDEADPWDECLVCTDDVIIDDWFRDRFWPQTDPESRWVFLLDSCFSETAGLRVVNPAAVSQEIPIRLPNQGSRWRLILSACGDEEQAFSSTRNPTGGQARSAITRAVVEDLQRRPQADYSQLWAQVAATVDRLRRHVDWIGVPRIWYAGINESFKYSIALHA